MSVHLNLCESCLQKQRILDRLQQQIQSLRKKGPPLERKAEQGPFGSSPPSAKIPVKANPAEEQRSQPGGASPGHPGHGRKAVRGSDAERIQIVPVGPARRHCGAGLAHKEYRDRPLIDSPPLRAEPMLYQIGSSDGDCAPSPSHTTVRTVFRIRRLNPAAVTPLQDPMA